MRDSQRRSSQVPDSSSRDKILEVAEPLFARLGFGGLGMRELADRVGMSKSALFHHFPSKNALYLAVLERALDTIDSRLADVAAPDPLARLRRWVDVFVATLAENPALAPLLLRTFFEDEGVSPQDAARVDALVDRILGRVGQCLLEGIASGQLREVSIPHTLQSLIRMTVYHFASDELGERVLAHSVYSDAAIRARREHLHQYIDFGLARGSR